MLELFLPGVFITILLTFLSLAVGLLFAIFFTCLLETHRWYFKYPLNYWMTFTRGVPLLVQIFLLYYGAAQFEWVRNSIFWGVLQEPFACALIALSLNSAAYTTTLLQGAIYAIPKGEIEACEVLNLSYVAKMRHVILKRALISAWPSYANEMIIILKSTALVSTITLLDVTGVMRQIITKTYEPTVALLVAGAFYLVFSAVLLNIHKFLSMSFDPKSL